MHQPSYLAAELAVFGQNLGPQVEVAAAHQVARLALE